jgi:hypothetical protein
MTKTFGELLEIHDLMEDMFTKNESLRNTKFGYAYKRFFEKNTKPLSDKMREEVADNQLENALVDEKTKEILYTDARQLNYRFDKEGTKRVIDFNRKIFKEYKEKVVEIIPWIITQDKDKPELTLEQQEMLTGLII